MKVLLAFPPVTDPRAPHLALPSLAAVLRRSGVETTMLDLDVEGLVALLSRESVAAAGRAVRAIAGTRSDDLLRLAAVSEYLESASEDAIHTLRDKTRFYDPHEYNLARGVIRDALELISASSAGVKYNILPIGYDVEGVDPAVLRDLIAVTADPGKNLFDPHWRRYVVPRIVAESPDLVGITITNRQQLLPALFLARTLRERGMRVVLGGTVLTKFVDTLKRRPAFFEHFADAVVVYEGETAILALVEQLEHGHDLSKVPNLLYLERGAVHQTPTHVEDVDALPPPDFAGLPLDSYLAPELVLPILTGKGCYFNRCKFCDIPYINHVSKKAYRLRRPSTVVEDCLSLKRRFGSRHFEITDEALSPRLLERLADSLRPHARERFCFVGYARLEPGFTAPLCRTLAEVGFKKIFFGLESASQATLDHMDKGVDVADAPVVLRNVRDAGIRFHLFSMIGFPEETEQSADETCAFFITHAETIDHPGNSFDIHPFGMELRTRYFAEAASTGVVIRPDALTKDFVIGLDDRSWSNARGLRPEEVERRIAAYLTLLRRVYRRYHNYPGQLWPGFEEYAVLYADRYGEGEFPYTTCLPDRDDPRPYRVARNPLTHVEERQGRVSLRGHDGAAEVSHVNYRFIVRPEPETFAETARALANAVEGANASSVETLYRDRVDTLLGNGLFVIRVAPSVPSSASSRAASTFDAR